MNNKEEDEIFSEIGNIFSKYKLKLPDVYKISEDLSRCVLEAKLKEEKKIKATCEETGFSYNRKTRRVFNL